MRRPASKTIAKSVQTIRYTIKSADFAEMDTRKEKGYKLVLMYSKANPTILYGDQSLDVTDDVIKRLNDAYAKEKEITLLKHYRLNKKIRGITPDFFFENLRLKLCC